MTKLTWDNAALIGPAMAQRLGVKNGDVVELPSKTARSKRPCWSCPGQADRCVTVHLGYGRQDSGIAANLGFNAYLLQTTAHRWIAPGLKIRKTGNFYELATTQHHFSMEGRDIIRVADVAESAPIRPSPRPSCKTLRACCPRGRRWGRRPTRGVSPSI